MRVVVIARSVVDLAARMTALDLNGGVSDGEAFTEAMLEVAHNMLGVREGAFPDDDVTAQRHGLRGQGPDMQIVHAGHLFGANDL